MNLRVLAGVVLTALFLSIIELSCVAQEDLGPAAPVRWSLDAPEPDATVETDVEWSASPILTH